MLPLLHLDLQYFQFSLSYGFLSTMPPLDLLCFIDAIPSSLTHHCNPKFVDLQFLTNATAISNFLVNDENNETA